MNTIATVWAAGAAIALTVLVTASTLTRGPKANRAIGIGIAILLSGIAWPAVLGAALNAGIHKLFAGTRRRH